MHPSRSVSAVPHDLAHEETAVVVNRSAPVERLVDFTVVQRTIEACVRPTRPRGPATSMRSRRSYADRERNQIEVAARAAPAYVGRFSVIPPLTHSEGQFVPFAASAECYAVRRTSHPEPLVVLSTAAPSRPNPGVPFCWGAGLCVCPRHNDVHRRRGVTHSGDCGGASPVDQEP
jgi:hypothetical protein